MKMPKNYLKKDYRDKAFTGFLIGYAEEGATGYELYIPDLQETIVGVHCTFKEFIPSYLRNDYQDKSFTGHLSGYSEQGAMGYKIYVPDLREAIVGALHFQRAYSFLFG